jgi:hypothetical protein
MITWIFLWWTILIVVGPWTDASTGVIVVIISLSIILPILIIIAAFGKGIHAYDKGMDGKGDLSEGIGCFLQLITFKSKLIINPILYLGAIPAYILGMYPVSWNRVGTLYGGPSLGTDEWSVLSAFIVCLISIVNGLSKLSKIK